MGLAKLVLGMVPDRVLSYVGVYVGLPNPRLDPATSSARNKQMAVWSRSSVTIVARPIRYPRGWPNVAEKPQEKGVDVKLAIDALFMAVTKQYEVAVIASSDSDLVPLLEALIMVKRRIGTPDIELIAWEGMPYRLRVSGEVLPEREVTRGAYQTIQDVTDYTS